MGTERLRIDPQQVRRGAGQLRQRADDADELSGEATRALARAGLTSPVPATLAEVDEELHLLAEILITRAEMANSHRLSLPSYPTDSIDRLWLSLVDDEGAVARIEGDNALEIINRNVGALDTDGDGFIGRSELRAAAANDANPMLAAAASSLLANDLALTDLEVITQRNARFTGTEPVISADALNQLLVINEQHRNDAAVAAAALAQGNATVEIDGELRDATELVAAAVNNRVHVHDAGAANEFLALLPNTANGVPGLSIFAFDTLAVEALYDTAMTDVADDDLLTRFDIVIQLPETTDGIRNKHITELYALGALALDAIVNPGKVGDPSLPGHAGNNWLGWGASASDSAKDGVTGDTKAWDLIPPTNNAKQLIADGNQLIATTVQRHYFEFIDEFDDGNISEEKVIDFLNTFEDGEGELQSGFALQLQVMTTDDPALRQQLQLESNITITLYEQTVVDDTLDFNQLELEAKVGSHLLTGALSLVSGGAPSSKSVSEVFTDQGVFALQQSDDSPIEFELDEPVPPGPTNNNLVGDFDVEGASNPSTHELAAVDIPGIEHVEPVTTLAEQKGLSNDYNAWDHTPVTANDWTKREDRMPQIIDLLHKQHVNPAVFESVEVILSAN